MKLIRFGVSLPQGLIKPFDRLIKRKNYPDRSEAIRDLIRKALIEEEIEQDAEVIGVLNILYDHHVPSISKKLNSLQHDYIQSIISTAHIYLDHDNCIEVILLRGKASETKAFADGIISTKGVKHGGLHLTSTGKKLP